MSFWKLVEMFDHRGGKHLLRGLTQEKVQNQMGKSAQEQARDQNGHQLGRQTSEC